MLTDSGFGFDSGSTSLRVASSGTISRALSAHPAGLRSTHCVFPPQSPGGLLLPVVLAPVLYASLFVQPCILHHASKPRTLLLTAFENTYIDSKTRTFLVHSHIHSPNIVTVICTFLRILRRPFQRGVAVVVAKMCCMF